MTWYDPTGHSRGQAGDISAAGGSNNNPGYNNGGSSKGGSSGGGSGGSSSSSNGPTITTGNGAVIQIVIDSKGGMAGINVISGNFDNSRNTMGATVNVNIGTSMTNPKGHNHKGIVNNWGTVHNYGYIGTVNNYGGRVNNHFGAFIKNLNTYGGSIINNGRINNYSIYGDAEVYYSGRGTIGATNTYKMTNDIATHSFTIELITKIAGAEFRASEQVMEQFIAALESTAGNLIVNGQYISFTQILNGAMYGNLFDFVDAVGGRISPITRDIGKRGGLVSEVVGYNVKFSTSRYAPTYQFYLDQNRKKGGISYKTINDPRTPGGKIILANLQSLVDAAGDKVTSLAYDLGSQGGTFIDSRGPFFANITTIKIIVPRDFATQFYEGDMSQVVYGLGSIQVGDTGSGIIGSILGGIIAQAYQNNRFKNELDKNYPFMNFFNVNSQSLFPSQDLPPGFNAHNNTIMEITGNSHVGIFHYGVYK